MMGGDSNFETASRASSRASSKSASTRRYRRVGNGSNVDESLFGGSARGNRLATTKKVCGEEDIVSPSATVLSVAGLQQIRQRSIIRSAEDIEREKMEKDRLREERQKAAIARKQRMLQMEAEAKGKGKRSELEMEEIARDELIRKMAGEALDDNHDLVKMFNSLGARAAAFTVRDKQIEEKERRSEKEAQYEKRMDLTMELERIKALQSRDEEEQAKIKKRHADRSVILDQIAERQRQHLLSLEAREQENQVMLATIRRYEEEDEKNAKARALAVEKSRKEVMEANEKSILAKREAREKEKEEVEAILAYQMQKDAEMRERELEEEQRAQQFKERQQKLLEGQQRVMDGRAELDELRARRAAEEKERQQRFRERSEAEKRRNDIRKLQEDRKRQAEMKTEQLKKEKELEQAEYEAALRYNSRMSEREQREAQQKREASMQHRDAIAEQIREAEARRKAERAAKFEEGRKVKAEYAMEKVKLEAMRDRLCEDMMSKGFSSKYMSEMKGVDISKLILR